MLLAAEDDLVVLDLAHHSGQAVQSVAEHQPAVLVLDAELPTGDLAERVAAAKVAAPTTKLLVLSGDTPSNDRGGARLRSRRVAGQGLLQPAAGSRHPQAGRR